MANLANPHELLTSFVAGLSEFLTTLTPSAQERQTISVYLYSVGGGSVSWTADVDYLIQNITCDGASGINIVVTIDNSTYAANHVAGVQKKGAILASFSANIAANFIQNTPIQAGQKIYVNNASASNASVLLSLLPRG